MIVGFTDLKGLSRPVYWKDDKVFALPFTPGKDAGWGTAADYKAEALSYLADTPAPGKTFTPESYAGDISDDGSIIVGSSTDKDGIMQPVYWTADGKITALKILPEGTYERHYASVISGDGKVIGGLTLGPSVPLLWRGLDSVPIKATDFLTGQGIDLTGWELYSITGLSQNGEVMTGHVQVGTNHRTWIAYIPQTTTPPVPPVPPTPPVPPKPKPDPGGIITPDDFDKSIITGPRVESGYALDVARHYDCSFAAAEGGNTYPNVCPFVVGSLSHGLNDQTADSHGGMAGISVALNPAWRVGFGGVVGRSKLDKLHNNGEAKTSGFGASIFTAWEPADKGLRLYGALTGMTLQSTLKRRYYNGARLETALGKPKGELYALDLMGGWSFPVREKLQVMPYLAYRGEQVKHRSFKEAGGVFKGDVKSHKETRHEARLGAELIYDMTPKLRLYGEGAVAYLNRKQDVPQVRVPVLKGMAFTGRRIKANTVYGEVSIGARYRFRPDMALHGRLSVAEGSKKAGVSAVRGTLGLSVSF